jgi:hypothetical protein
LIDILPFLIFRPPFSAVQFSSFIAYLASQARKDKALQSETANCGESIAEIARVSGAGFLTSTAAKKAIISVFLDPRQTLYSLLHICHTASNSYMSSPELFSHDVARIGSPTYPRFIAYAANVEVNRHLHNIHILQRLIILICSLTIKEAHLFTDYKAQVLAGLVKYQPDLETPKRPGR